MLNISTYCKINKSIYLEDDKMNINVATNTVSQLTNLTSFLTL